MLNILSKSSQDAAPVSYVQKFANDAWVLVHLLDLTKVRQLAEMRRLNKQFKKTIDGNFMEWTERELVQNNFDLFKSKSNQIFYFV